MLSDKEKRAIYDQYGEEGLKVPLVCPSTIFCCLACASVCCLFVCDRRYQVVLYM